MKRKIVSWFLLHKLFGSTVENKAFCLNGVYHPINYYNQKKRGRTMTTYQIEYMGETYLVTLEDSYELRHWIINHLDLSQTCTVKEVA